MRTSVLCLCKLQRLPATSTGAFESVFESYARLAIPCGACPSLADELPGSISTPAQICLTSRTLPSSPRQLKLRPTTCTLSSPACPLRFATYIAAYSQIEADSYTKTTQEYEARSSFKTQR